MTRNQPGQIAGSAQMNNATSGLPVTVGVSVNVTIDNGPQLVGTGTLTHKGNGEWQYAPTQAETNGLIIAYQFVASGAVSVVINVPTFTPAQNAAFSQASSPTSITVSRLLELAMKRCNYLAAGDSLTNVDAQDGLALANSFLDYLSVQSLTIPYILGTQFPMTSGKASYTIGVGGDINIPNPTILTHVNYIDGSLNPPIERELPYLTDDAWAAIPIKGLTNPLPTFYYWLRTYSGAQSTLYFWLVPTSSQLTGVLYAPAQLGLFGNLSDTLALPPAARMMLQENLAVYFSSTLRENIPIDPNLVKSASDSLAAYKRSNIRLQEMVVDPALTYGSPRSNIYVGP